jgi:hypothetical protein
MIVGSMSFLAADSAMKAALVFGNRYPCCLSFFARVSLVSVQKHSERCEWMWMLRSAFLDPLLNFYLNGAVFKVVDGRKQVVHIFSASEWVSGKTKWRM